MARSTSRRRWPPRAATGASRRLAATPRCPRRAGAAGAPTRAGTGAPGRDGAGGRTSGHGRPRRARGPRGRAGRDGRSGGADRLADGDRKGLLPRARDRRLNPDHPDIAHDLTHPLPRSAPASSSARLHGRARRGLRPFTVLTCDNLPANGRAPARPRAGLRRKDRPGPRRLDRGRGALPRHHGRPHRARHDARGHRHGRAPDRPPRRRAGAARTLPAMGDRGRFRRRRPPRSRRAGASNWCRTSRPSST
jgi:hypothetical protein